MDHAERIAAAIAASLAGAEPERPERYAGSDRRWIEKAAMPTPILTEENGVTRISAILSSSRVDAYGDRILPAALREWLENRPDTPMVMLQEHDRTRVAGAWDQFSLAEDDGETYLHASGVLLADLMAGKECEILFDRGFLNATSVGAFIGNVERAPGSNVWNIGSIDIREASLVLWPANTDATIDRLAA